MIIGGGGVVTPASKVGSMYMYDATQVISVDTVDVYQAVIGFSEGSVNTGLTFLASLTGVITDTEDNGSGKLRCTDVGHGLTTGQYISVHGMADAAHDGFSAVTVITSDVFDCADIDHNSDSDTGNWSRGSSLTVDSGGDGIYKLSVSASVTAAANNKQYTIELVKNTTSLDEFACERKIGIGADLGNMGSDGPEQLASGDTVWLAVKCTTDATNITFKHVNVNAVRA